MKNIWKKYTRTREQRANFSGAVFVLIMLALAFKFMFPLFVFLMFLGAVFGSATLVVWLIGKWVMKGDEY